MNPKYKVGDRVVWKKQDSKLKVKITEIGNEIYVVVWLSHDKMHMKGHTARFNRWHLESCSIIEPPYTYFNKVWDEVVNGFSS